MPDRKLTAQKRVRLADIAKVAKVTIPTVSHVLAGRARTKRISEALEKRIQEIARRLGYRPNLLARSLITQRSMTIGILVANLGESFYPAVMARLHHQVRQHGYLLLFTNHYCDAKLFREEVHALQQRSVDAIVLGPVPEPIKDVREICEMAEQCPVVAFEWSHPALDCVLNSAKALGRTAADYLLGKGVRKVLAISLEEKEGMLHGLPSVLEERLKWFQKRFESRVRNTVTIWRMTNAEDLVERLIQALSANELTEFDGFFFPKKLAGELFLNETLHIQPDLLGRETILISGEAFRPSLRRHMAVLYQDPSVIGDRLAEKLLARIENRQLKPETLDVPAELLERI